MAKSKEYDNGIVENEFNKLPLTEQIEAYHALGEWIHKKVEAHQKHLGDQLNTFEVAKKSLITIAKP